MALLAFRFGLNSIFQKCFVLVDENQSVVTFFLIQCSQIITKGRIIIEMIPGPTLHYKCTRCENLTKRKSLLSGNTFGSILYSDGRQVSPMLPEFPAIVKCKNCQTFYWLKDENKVSLKCQKTYSTGALSADWEKDVNNNCLEAREAYWAEFLSVDEYDEAISSKIYRNEDELKFLRIRLWWSFNDRIRKKGNIFSSEKDQKMYEQNCLELIHILDKKDINERTMVAELYRNLGNFDESCKILETLDEYIWIKELLINECNKNNKYLVVLR